MPPINPLPVCASDLENLQASGLTVRTIRANRLHSEELSLVFPYRDLDGKVNCFARRRPHQPPIVDGRPVKYLQPPGSPLRAYLPFAALGGLRDGLSDIYLTEGEKKALALSQLNRCAVGIGGIWCGTQKRDDGTHELIPDLQAIPWNGRTVFIVFDYDESAETRKAADHARRRLAQALRDAGAARVLFIDLPPGANGSKQGVDDFIVANGAESFRQLVEQATRPTQRIDAMDLKAEDMPETVESLPLLGRDGLIPKGLFTVVAGPPKWGKSTLIYQSLKLWLEAGERILWLTEESRISFRQRLFDPDIIKQRGLDLVFGHGLPVDVLLDIVREGTDSVVILDTMRNLGILEDENDNGKLAKDLAPWISACRDAGKTLIGLHHSRKSGGDHGHGVAGGHALVGCADCVLELRRGKADNVRVISALSRIGQPDDLTYRLLDDGLLEAIDAAEVATPSTPKPKPADIVAALPQGPPGITVEDLIKQCHVAKDTALFVLSQALKRDEVVLTGKGVKGDPKQYHRR